MQHDLEFTAFADAVLEAASRRGGISLKAAEDLVDYNIKMRAFGWCAERENRINGRRVVNMAWLRDEIAKYAASKQRQAAA
jgi:hypothetical protein